MPLFYWFLFFLPYLFVFLLVVILKLVDVIVIVLTENQQLLFYLLVMSYKIPRKNYCPDIYEIVTKSCSQSYWKKKDSLLLIVELHLTSLYILFYVIEHLALGIFIFLQFDVIAIPSPWSPSQLNFHILTFVQNLT